MLPGPPRKLPLIVLLRVSDNKTSSWSTFRTRPSTNYLETKVSLETSRTTRLSGVCLSAHLTRVGGREKSRSRYSLSLSIWRSSRVCHQRRESLTVGDVRVVCVGVSRPRLRGETGLRHCYSSFLLTSVVSRSLRLLGFVGGGNGVPDTERRVGNGKGFSSGFSH